MRYGTIFVLYRVSTKTSTPNLSLDGNVGKSPRKSEVHLVLVVHVGGNLKERSIACLLGSGTYLEGSGYSIANFCEYPKPFWIENGSVLEEEVLWIYLTLHHYAQGGCRRGRSCLTGAWYDMPVGQFKNASWNILKWLAMAGATHTFFLSTATHHDSKCKSHILNVR